EPELPGDEDVVALAQRVRHVPGLLVEDGDAVEHRACVFPQLGGLVEAPLVDGDGEPGVLAALLPGAVFGVTGEVALDGDRDLRGHPSLLPFVKHPIWMPS